MSIRTRCVSEVPVSGEASYHRAEVSAPYTVQGGVTEHLPTHALSGATSEAHHRAHLTASQLLPLARLIAREMMHESGDQCYDGNTP